MRFEKRASVESKIKIFHSKLSRTGNRASVDWTVGKLLNIILALVVLALIAYGISTQSLNPLWDNISGKFDEVKILFNLKDDVSSGDCHEERVSLSGEGRDFLKAIGMEGKEVILNVCKNRICNISGEGLGDYRTNKGNFEKWDGEKWMEYNSLLVEGIGSAEFNWELYNASVGVLEDVKDLYDKGFTKKFVLYGNRKILLKKEDICASWQNGEWRVKISDKIPDGENWFKKEEKIGDGWVNQTWAKPRYIAGFTAKYIKTYSTSDDNKAIDMFADIVDGVIDYKVHWKETIPTKPDEQYISSSNYGESIETLAGNIGLLSSPDELDNKDEVKNLKSKFAVMKEKYLSEMRILVKSAGGEAELGKAIEEIRKIVVGGKTFDIGIEKNIDFPIITLSFGEKKYGFRHSAYAKINSNLLSGVKLRDFPVVLVEKVGSEWKEIGNEEYYRLPKENFDEVYRATLISQFLKSRCK